MCQIGKLQSVTVVSYKTMGIGLQNATFGLRNATGVKKCERLQSLAWLQSATLQTSEHRLK